MKNFKKRQLEFQVVSDKVKDSTYMIVETNDYSIDLDLKYTG